MINFAPWLKSMKHLFYILVACVLVSSCSEYQQALKSEEIAPKFKLGTELYEAGKYAKANRLFQDIVPNYRGKPQAEKLMFMYANSFYNMKQYYTAAYQFERFASAYPNSEKAQEAAFLSAKSEYQLSPVYKKDQSDTRKSLDKLQAFINNYPDSEYLAEANMLVKELDGKLETKAFEIAKQYNTVSDYQASIKSFDNFLFNFPGTSLREEALFYRLDSAYKLAMNSVEYKKKDRLNTAKTYCKSFQKLYADSKFADETSTMLTKIDKQLQNFKS